MIKINLLPVPKVRKQEALIIQAFAGIAALVIVAFACYLVGIQKKERNAMQAAENSALEQKIKELTAQVGEVEKYKKQAAVLEEQLGVIRALEKGRSGPVKMMDELTELIPRRVWITTFKESQKKVTIDGFAESGMVIADFLDSLKGSRFFQNPNLIVVNGAEQEGQAIHKFQITMMVKYDL